MVFLCLSQLRTHEHSEKFCEKFGTRSQKPVINGVKSGPYKCPENKRGFPQLKNKTYLWGPHIKKKTFTTGDREPTLQSITATDRPPLDSNIYYMEHLVSKFHECNQARKETHGIFQNPSFVQNTSMLLLLLNQTSHVKKKSFSFPFYWLL